jgi:TolB-like protein
MSSDKEQEYFSDGLPEELLNDLAKIPGLRVAARTSSFQFKGKNEDLRTVGEKLNVGAILEGSVRKEGSRVRITAQLIKAGDGFHLWSETYDRELSDIFVVQEDIARSVAGSLKVALLGGKTATPSARGTNVEAYNAYLQGRYFLERGSKENVEKAIGYYEQAIKLDSGYAPAWVGLEQGRPGGDRLTGAAAVQDTTAGCAGPHLPATADRDRSAGQDGGSLRRTASAGAPVDDASWRGPDYGAGDGGISRRCDALCRRQGGGQLCGDDSERVLQRRPPALWRPDQAGQRAGPVSVVRSGGPRGAAG